MKLKMAIQKIFKGSDIQLNLNIKDKTNAVLRVSDLDEYTIKLFTKSGNTFCSGSWIKSTGILTNISVTDTADILFIGATDLATLEEGLIYYQYHIKSINSNYEDGYFDEVVEGETKFYLKNNQI